MNDSQKQKAYHTPRLIVYGSIRAITQSKSNGGGDTTQPSHSSF
jgi:hypothetical protein